MSENQPESGETAQSEWWDDPSLPWRKKPGRADLICLGWLSAVAIYAVVISVLRPGLLASAPHVLASLGSWSGTILIGAMARVGDPWWPVIWVLGTIGLIKFDWVYWWAGKLWGRSLIESWSGRSARARKWNERAERFTRKYETWAIAITFLPLPLPRGVIFAVLGEVGTSLRKFLTVSVISAFVSMGIYLAIGYWIGEPAVAVMEAYGRYLWFVSLAILAWVVYKSWRSAGPNKNHNRPA